MEDHEWHLFDAEKGIEVRRVHGRWQLRHVDNREDVQDLSDEAFEKMRAKDSG
jgi:hypothetical protein